MSTSVVIYPGNSGSPIFNDDNYVVGVVFASSNADHYGHYVPLEYLHRLLERY
jgi:V8-like Glu-specific endopeptidase